MTSDQIIARASVLAVAASGLIGSSPWVIAAGALMLSSLRSEAGMTFVDRHGAALGRLEAASLFAATALTRNALVCAATYAAGIALKAFV